MKKWLILFTVLFCLSLYGCGNGNGGNQTTESQESTHQHTFGDWRVVGVPNCRQEGEERRNCTECNFEEARAIEKTPHTYSNGRTTCGACRYVNLDADALIVEMGNTAPYEVGNLANYVWDVKIFNGVLYRGAGDYDKNSGDTPFITFHLENRRWLTVDKATDEAIHRFVEIDGKLYAPGIDSRDGGGWDLGNYYVLENNRWVKVRNVPKGIHCFDMIGFDGKMFIGVGTGESQKVVGISTDKGESWTYLPMYKDGQLMDVSGHNQDWSRCYEFVEFDGKLYALVSFKEESGYVREIFVYEDGKMVYVGSGAFGGRVSRNYWQSKFEFNGKCFITAKGLYAVTDFSKPDSITQVKLPDGETATDAILYNNEMYVLSCKLQEDGSYKTVIYKTATGEAGSFTEVVSYDYEGIPYSFDYDGKYFYVGIGAGSKNDATKAGMMLRIKPAA